MVQSCDCSFLPDRIRSGRLITVTLILLRVLNSRKKIKKIKIKVNGKFSTINENLSLFTLLNQLKIPLKKVAIELNHEIVDKKKLNNIKLRKDDKIEIVHFIGGG